MESAANSAPPPDSPYGMPSFYSSEEWRSLRLAVKIRDSGQCRYCGKTAQTADHIVPRKRGGSDDLENLVACCRACNTVVLGRVFATFNEKKNWILWARQQDS
jgi:5-methylcytosine-specific restriction endonuclease McrA